MRAELGWRSGLANRGHHTKHRGLPQGQDLAPQSTAATAPLHPYSKGRTVGLEAQ